MMPVGDCLNNRLVAYNKESKNFKSKPNKQM